MAGKISARNSDFWPDIADRASGKIAEAFSVLNEAPGHSAIFEEAQMRLNEAYFVLQQALKEAS